MKTSTLKQFERLPRRVALIYGGLATAWIILSDWISALLLDRPLKSMLVDMGKGLVFTTVTTTLLYLLLSRLMRPGMRHLSDLQNLNLSLRAISTANSLIMSARSETELLSDFCVTMMRITGHKLVWVAMVVPGNPVLKVAASAGKATGYLEGNEIRYDDTPAGNGPSGRAVKTGQTQVCEDFTKDPLMGPWRERAAKFGLRSSIAVPLRIQGRNTGVFTLYSDQPRRFDADEVELLQKLADDLAYGIDNLRTTERLREERQIREAYMEHSAALIYVVDLEDRFIYTNPALDRAVGLASESATGRNRTELLPPEVAASHHANDLKVAASGRAITMEEPNVERGEKRMYLTTKFPLKDENGRVYAVGGVSTDITEQQEAKAQMEAYRERLENVIHAARLGTWEWDITTDHVSYNDYWASMLGYRLEELMPTSLKTWRELAHPDDVPGVMEKVQAHLDGKTPLLECEYRMRHRDGRWLWISDRSQLLKRTSSGEPWMMFGIHEDITLRKKARQDLIESETKLRTSMDRAADAVFVHDEDGRLLDVNQRACDSLGYSREELLQLCVFDVDIDTDRAATRIVWSHIGLHESQTALGHHRRKNGAVFPVEVHLGVFDLGGKRHFMALVRDITARLAVEAQLKRHIKELEVFNQASVGREMRMLDLKREVNRLSKELGRAEPYSLDFETQQR